MSRPTSILMTAATRPRFRLVHCTGDVLSAYPPLFSEQNATWVPLVTCSADFPIEVVGIYFSTVWPFLRRPRCSSKSLYHSSCNTRNTIPLSSFDLRLPPTPHLISIILHQPSEVCIRCGAFIGSFF